MSSLLGKTAAAKRGRNRSRPEPSPRLLFSAHPAREAIRDLQIFLPDKAFDAATSAGGPLPELAIIHHGNVQAVIGQEHQARGLAEIESHAGFQEPRLPALEHVGLEQIDGVFQSQALELREIGGGQGEFRWLGHGLVSVSTEITRQQKCELWRITWRRDTTHCRPRPAPRLTIPTLSRRTHSTRGISTSTARASSSFMCSKSATSPQ